MQKYLLIATDCVSDAVLDIAQTYIDKLSEDEWTDESKKQAFDMARKSTAAFRYNWSDSHEEALRILRMDRLQD